MSTIFTERLSQLLLKNGMKQRDLAKAIGVTEVTVSRYIKGTRTPTGPICSKIACTLHTTVDYLLGVDDRDDSEFKYKRVYQDIVDNAKEWSLEQKTDLVIALFKSE